MSGNDHTAEREKQKDKCEKLSKHDGKGVTLHSAFVPNESRFLLIKKDGCAKWKNA